jgi:NAD(P)-dependent dehydrogenase (short-subunit alcohol dehydrogenase family)
VNDLAEVENSKSGKKRVSILVDTETHMMPALAREMVRRNHNLVIGNVADGLAEELKQMGADVEVVSERLDLTKSDAVQKLVDAANKRFGGFDSACIRSGAHGTGEILEATAEQCDDMYQGNFKSVFFALKAILPPLVQQGSGQVVINTSSSGIRPAVFVPLYSAMRAAANSLVRSSALSVSPKGVAVNATGTYAMDYPAFLEDTGANDPEVRKQVEAELPMRRLCKPEEAAHFVATLIDGVGTFQTGQFFSIDGGWAFV